MTEPLVSIIIPAYNSGKYIRKCLDSIVAQTHQNWEAIVVYAPSNDDTFKQLLGYEDGRIVVLGEGRKSNVATARNRGFGMCRGEYVIFLDSDDWIEPSRLAHQVSIMERIAHAQWCWGYVKSVRENGEWEINDTDPTQVKDSLMGILSIMFRRGCVVKFDEALPYFDDVDFFLKIRELSNCKVYCVVTNYRLNSCGLTQSTKPIDREIAMFKILIRNGAWEYFPREIKEAVASIGSNLLGVDLVRWKKENFG